MATSYSNNSEFGRRVSQKEIAEKVGVSVSTVSRALSNKPSTLSEELKQRVKEVAEEIFRSNNMFGNNAPLKNITLFIGTQSTPYGFTGDPFYTDILLGIEGECKKRGFQLSLTTIETHQDNISSILEKIKQTNIDGAIFLALDDRELLEEVYKRGLPAVLVNTKLDGLPMDNFQPNYREGTSLAIHYLLKKGHKRIMHIANLTRPTLQARFEAYRSTLEAAGLYDPALVLPVTPGKEEEQIRQFFKNNKTDFTAIFCVTDVFALQTIKILREFDLRVPQDYSIIGFDDLEVVNLIDPPLTTIRVERQQLAARAVRGLIDRVAYPDSVNETVEIACSLVERKSVLDLNH